MLQGELILPLPDLQCQESIQSQGQGVQRERETMRKTLDLYELERGDHNKALLLLGQAVKYDNKSNKSGYYSVQLGVRL